METENYEAAREATVEEEERDDKVLQCPYKRLKIDDECVEQQQNASLVATIENPKDLSSNGDDDGNQPEFDDGVERDGEDGDGDSENGEKFVDWVWLDATVTQILLGYESENGYGSDDNYEEIESLLDQALPEELKNKKRDYEERFKIIMEGKLRHQLVV